MNIREFLIKERTGSACVYVFHGRSCPSLFLSTFLPRVAANRTLVYAPVFTETGDSSAFERRCYMGFFGNPSFLWCGDVSTLTAAVRKSVLAVSATYAGPHHIGLFCSEKEKDAIVTATVVHIPCDDPINREFFLELVQLLGLHVAGSVWDAWTAKRGALGLDDACRLIWYAATAGDQVQAWFAAWETRLFVGEQSLFKLSQYFFARDRAAFMKLWQSFRDEYPPEFWVVYWSEQLWQAHMIVTSMRQKIKPPVTNRLPFSFLQRDWHKYEPRELVAAHTTLYNTDFCLKNGIADTYGIELFVLKFISGGFARA